MIPIKDKYKKKKKKFSTDPTLEEQIRIPWFPYNLDRQKKKDSKWMEFANLKIRGPWRSG